METPTKINQDTIAGSILELVGSTGKKAFELAVGELLSVLNLFFSSILGEMQAFTSEPKNINDEYQRSVSLLNAIRVVMQDPEFQAEIMKLTGFLEDIIRPIMTSITTLVEQEGDDLAKSAYKLTNTLTRNAIGGIEDGVDGAVAAIPGVGTIWEAIKLITLAIQSGTEISIAFLDAATKFANAYLDIIGTVSPNVANVLKSALSIFELIQNARERVIQTTQNARQFVDNIKTPLGKNISKRVVSAIPKPSQFISSPTDVAKRAIVSKLPQVPTRPTLPQPTTTPTPSPTSRSTTKGGKKHKLKRH
jgi:hypothetical protein